MTGYSRDMIQDNLALWVNVAAPAVPSYAQETATSLKRTMPNMATSSETPLSARDSVHSSLTSISCENDEPEQGLQQPHLAVSPNQVYTYHGILCMMFYKIYLDESV